MVTCMPNYRARSIKSSNMQTRGLLASSWAALPPAFLHGDLSPSCYKDEFDVIHLRESNCRWSRAERLAPAGFGGFLGQALTATSVAYGLVLVTFLYQAWSQVSASSEHAVEGRQ